MALVYIKKLGFWTCKINITIQIINGFYLANYKIVVTGIQKTFLLANANINVILKKKFLIFSNANILFID